MRKNIRRTHIWQTLYQIPDRGSSTLSRSSGKRNVWTGQDLEGPKEAWQLNPGWDPGTEKGHWGKTSEICIHGREVNSNVPAWFLSRNRCTMVCKTPGIGDPEWWGGWGLCVLTVQLLCNLKLSQSHILLKKQKQHNSRSQRLCSLLQSLQCK